MTTKTTDETTSTWTRDEYAKMTWRWISDYMAELDGDDLSDDDRIFRMAGFVQQIAENLSACER